MGELAVKPLDPSTWSAFAELVARDGGVWGGCWCLEFHLEGRQVGGYDERQAEKRRLHRQASLGGPHDRRAESFAA